MSIRLMSHVWPLDLPDSAKIVLLALADFADEDGRCWPSMRRLVGKCSKSERTIQAAIRLLVARGHLDRTEVIGRGCRYVVHPRRTMSGPGDDRTPAAPAPPQRVVPTPAAAADKPSRPPSSEADASSPCARPGRGCGAPAAGPDLPEWLPAEPWAAFVEMRRATPRVPFTATAARAILAQLADFHEQGHDIGAILMRSVVGGYRGVYAPDRPAGARPGVAPGRAWSAADKANYLRRIERIGSG